MMEYLQRLYAIQHKRAEVLAHIHEDYFKQDKLFKYREILEDLNEDLDNMIMENPQDYEAITGDINVDLVLSENNQFRFVEDSGLIISKIHRRVAKGKAKANAGKARPSRATSDMPIVSMTVSCPACDKQCESSAALYEHIGETHFDNPYVVCNHNDCEEAYYIQNIKEHEEEYHPELGEICELCNTAFTSRSLLLEHVKEHGCKPIGYRRRRGLEAHKQKQHADKGEEEAGAGGEEEPENDENINYDDKAAFERSYNGAAELYDVRDTVDDEGNPQKEVFICVNKGLVNESVHPMANAPGVTDFLCGEKTLTNSCDLCNMDFDRMEEMVTHLKTRHHQYTIKGYRCDQCSFVTHFRSLLGKHKNTVHGGKYKCEYCGKLSKDSGNHNRHRNIHRNIVYRCTAEGCNAIYKSLKAFNVHTLSHSNSQPVFNCDYLGCKYSSHYQNAVNVHKLTHTDLRNFVCPYESCRKGFKRNGDLNKHVNHSHKGEKRSYKGKKRRIEGGATLLYRCRWAGCGYTTGDSVDLNEHESTTHVDSSGIDNTKSRVIKVEFEEEVEYEEEVEAEEIDEQEVVAQQIQE